LKEGSAGNKKDKDFAQIEWINILTKQKRSNKGVVTYVTIQSIQNGFKKIIQSQ